MNKILRNIILCTINKHFPLSKTGRKVTSADIILDELLHMLWSGSPWRALRCKGTSFQTVHRHFTKWSRSGVFKEAYADMLAIINFLLCIVAALKGRARPTHLCRPWKATT